MPEITCPHCGETFAVDESSYNALLSHVRNEEFEKELNDRLNREIGLVNDKNKLENEKALQTLHNQIQALTFQIQNAEADKRAALDKLEIELNLAKEKSESKNEKTIQELTHKIELLNNQISTAQADKKAAIDKLEGEHKIEIEKKNGEISRLQESEKIREENKNNEIQLAKDEIEKANSQIITDLKNQITDLEHKLETTVQSGELDLAHQKDTYELQIKQLEQSVEFYKDLKLRMSTKMLGESLEQHCQNEFNKIRTTAFPNAYFEKDNDVKEGTKGDYIYRETDVSGAEVLSIMFEMKNESDTTSTKKTNKDFFEKLDKDRNEKKCEYAVLVSLLEPENELYNSGIVDVSYAYPKMYVIRPQNFLTMIGILRNASLNALDYKRQLVEAKNQTIDFSRFEDQLTDFQKKFGTSVRYAKQNFDDSIKEIDEVIKMLEGVKESIRLTGKHLITADKKAQQLTVKSLTKDNPTVKALLDEARQNKIEDTSDSDDANDDLFIDDDDEIFEVEDDE